jgi:hypothetical protein
MKNAIMIAGLAMLMLASCKKDAPAPVVPPTPPPIEDPAPPKAPEPKAEVPPQPTTHAEEQKDGTSVSFDANGISLKDKNGNNSKDITISKSKKEVKINTD